MAISINGKELQDYIKKSDLKQTQLSSFMGRSPSYLSYVISKGTMSETAYVELCKKLGVPYGTFRPTDTPEEVFRLNLVYNDSKVLVQLMSGEDVVCGAWAIIKEPTRLGFLQAISYASHMMYKFAEQHDLNKEESA